MIKEINSQEKFQTPGTTDIPIIRKEKQHIGNKMT